MIFLVEGEEEIGSPSLGPVIERLRGELQADACVWEDGNRSLDGRPIVSAGVKGMAYVELTCRGASVDMHSSMATLVPNPAWRLVWALATLKAPDGTITLDGFLDHVRPAPPEVRGRARAIPFDAPRFLETWGLQGFTQPRDPAALMEMHLLEPTANLCGLGSGYQGPGAKTVLPHEARAKLDFRLVPEQDSGEVVRLLRAHLERRGFGDITVEEINGEEPYRCDPSHPIVAAALAAARDAGPAEPLFYPNMAGTGPMAQICGTLGIPAVGFGVAHAASRLHAPDENIYLEHYLEGILQVAFFLERYAAA